MENETANLTTEKYFVATYGDANLNAFSHWYSGIHGYVSLTICAIGIPLNILNIAVLTRKKLRTPINFILTWLAVFDMATMISYVPFAIHFYCQNSAHSISAAKNSKPWMTFLLVYLNISSTAHTISIWLAVALAILRHNHIHSPAKGSITRSRRMIRARIAVVTIVVSSLLVMIPNFASHNLVEVHFRDNSSGYIFEAWNLGTGDEKPIIVVGMLLYSCLAKLVPCVLIIIYGGLLLVTLNNTRLKRSHRLTESASMRCHSLQRNVEMSRTTIMLLIVIVLFLLTELPQGVLIMCCIFKRNFFENVYIPLGDSMDIIALMNSSINFVLYCSMSKEFRVTFVKLICKIAHGGCGTRKQMQPSKNIHHRYTKEPMVNGL